VGSLLTPVSLSEKEITPIREEDEPAGRAIRCAPAEFWCSLVETLNSPAVREQGPLCGTLIKQGHGINLTREMV
jgi:hypothetical protein